MVFTSLCMGNQVGGLYHLQRFLAKYCITIEFNDNNVLAWYITIVNNKIA